MIEQFYSAVLHNHFFLHIISEDCMNIEWERFLKPPILYSRLDAAGGMGRLFYTPLTEEDRFIKKAPKFIPERPVVQEGICGTFATTYYDQIGRLAGEFEVVIDSHPLNGPIKGTVNVTPVGGEMQSFRLRGLKPGSTKKLPDGLFLIHQKSAEVPKNKRNRPQKRTVTVTNPDGTSQTFSIGELRRGQKVNLTDDLVLTRRKPAQPQKPKSKSRRSKA